MPVKYILVSGGVVSGVGKGLCASSIGALLKCCGWNVTAVKLDPYLNPDERLMDPSRNGDVFVLDDGAFVNSDIGNYERFLGIRMTSHNHITTGKVYEEVIAKEREGEYLGKTVQVVPHVTNAIQECITRVGTSPIITHDGKTAKTDVVVIELGGTVGDMESLPFIEALRQLRHKVGEENFCSVLVSLIPTITGPEGALVQKTKPTQHGVKELNYRGLEPDIIICRSEQELAPDVRRSVSMSCHVAEEGVMSVVDVANVWKIPRVLQGQGMCILLNKKLQMEYKLPTLLENWHKYSVKADVIMANTEAKRLRVVLVVPDRRTKSASKTGDANLSTLKALKHAAIAMEYPFSFEVVNAAELQVEEAPAEGSGRTSPGLNPNSKEAKERQIVCDAWKVMREADAVVMINTKWTVGEEEAKVSPSFLGLLNAIKHCRVSSTPFLGIGLGMHMAVIEAARNLGGMPDANSTEIAPSKHAVVVKGSECEASCFGSVKTILHDKESLCSRLYMGAEAIYPRYCQNYQMNPDCAATVEACGLTIVSRSANGTISVVERTDHPFFMGIDYHPEYTTRPGSPSPVFVGLLLAARPAEEEASSLLTEYLPMPREGKLVLSKAYLELMKPELW